VARIMEGAWEGPAWDRKVGYQGRSSLRVLIDGEDLCHSYAQARYEQTGKWTGPLSQAIEQALTFGGWGGGQPEDPDPERADDDVNLQSPDILVFVGMPADMIEAINPAHLCDGYPETVRRDTETVQLHEEGYFVNTFLQGLQDQSRLITWSRPGRHKGQFVNNALIKQKYYKQGDIWPLYDSLDKSPIMLTQCMGTGFTIKVGDKVEALKPGKLVQDGWLPSKWEEAEVKAVNYDGTYDVQFFMKFGPVRERRKELRGLKGKAALSLGKAEVYAENWGADKMPAAFRMMQEMNYAQALPASKIRLVGAMDRLSDTYDGEANQDWYLCSTRNFRMTRPRVWNQEDNTRLYQFRERFQFSYKWVPTPEGDLKFEPVPNEAMEVTLATAHKDVAQKKSLNMRADEETRRQLALTKEKMEMFTEQVSENRAAPPLDLKPAGPRPRISPENYPELEPVGAEPVKRTRRIAQELAADANRRPSMGQGFGS